MSEKIREIIDVVLQTRNEYNASGESISKCRLNATKRVAAAREITIQSIQDKYSRKINLYTDQFDKLLEGWLLSNSSELKDIILKNADDNEKDFIQDAFRNIIEVEDAIIEYEFGAVNQCNANKTYFERDKYKYHLYRERNGKVVKDAKEEWAKQQGKNIECSICGFSFVEKYGGIGELFIEAHHLVPLSKLEGDTPIKTDDLIAVCSNCHRMLHRMRTEVSIEEFKENIKNRNGTTFG